MTAARKIAPCARCDQLASALLSWERLWGPEGSDLAAMEARVVDAEASCAVALQLYWSMCAELAELLGESTDIPGTFLVARVRDRLAGKATSPSPPAPSAAYGVQLALDALSTSRGVSRREVATRAGISLHSAGKALSALAGEGLAYESTPGLWRRR